MNALWPQNVTAVKTQKLPNRFIYLNICGTAIALDYPNRKNKKARYRCMH